MIPIYLGITGNMGVLDIGNSMHMNKQLLYNCNEDYGGCYTFRDFNNHYIKENISKTKQ